MNGRGSRVRTRLRPEARTRGVTAALLTGLNAVSALGNSAGALVATMALAPDERGVMVLVTTITSVAVVLARTGTGAALRAQLPATGAGHHRDALQSAYVWVTILATGVAVTGALLAVRFSAGFIDPRMAAGPVLAAVAVLAVAQTLLGQFNELLFADGEFRRGARWSMTAVAAGLVGIVLAAALRAEVWLLLLLQGVGLLAVTAVQWYLLHRGRGVPLALPSRPIIMRLVWMGMPSLGLILGFTLAQRVDRYLLGAAAGTATVGIYSLAATLSGVAGLLPSALGQLALHHVATGGSPARLRRLFRLAVVGAVLAGLLAGAGGWILIVPVFGAEFAGARSLLLPLLIAEVCLAPYWVASRALLGGGWTRTTGLIGAASAVAALVLYGSAVSRWGMIGAALACVVLYAGLSCASVITLRRHLRVRASAAAPARNRVPDGPQPAAPARYTARSGR